MPGPCWWDELANIEICDHVLGPDYDAAVHSTNGSGPPCYIGIREDEANAGQSNCAGCDVGCVHCIDEPGPMIFWADNLEGHSYLRAHVPSPHHRDATNRLVDLVANSSDNKPVLFFDRITLERTPCYENQLNISCWSHIYPDADWPTISPCECHHGTLQYGFDCAPGVPPAFPVIGFVSDSFFYHRYKWPVNASDSPPSLHCRRWNGDGIEVVDVSANRKWQTVFLAHGPWTRCASDLLVRCESEIPENSECSEGEGPDFNCSAMRPLVGGPGQKYIPSGAESQQYVRMIIHSTDVRHRSFPWLSDAIKRDIAIRNEVFRRIRLTTFPDSSQPDGTLDFFQLDHQAIFDGNQSLGLYKREWVAESMDATPGLLTLAGRTLWGGCPVTGELVITRISIWSHVYLHHGYILTGNTRTDYVTPYIAVHIQVKLGINATLEGDCVVDGEPVTITGGEMPSVTPDGNEILWQWNAGSANGGFGVVRVPNYIDWKGSLNQHSSPPAEPIQIWDVSDIPDEQNDPEPDSLRCNDIRAAIGQVTIPALPGREGTEDANTYYEGEMVVSFGG